MLDVMVGLYKEGDIGFQRNFTPRTPAQLLYTQKRFASRLRFRLETFKKGAHSVPLPDF
jgi:hypothetical protein